MLVNAASIAAFALASLPFAQAEVWNVNVGGDSLTFNPNQLTPAVGDTIHFIFGPQNHSVVQTSLNNPCTQIPKGGFNSGFFAVEAGAATPPTFDVLVNSTDPIWITCGQVGHCPAGMVFAANANNTGDKSFDKFMANAMALGNNTMTESMIMSMASGATVVPSATGSSAPGAATTTPASGALSSFGLGWSIIAIAGLGIVSGTMLSL